MECRQNVKFQVYIYAVPTLKYAGNRQLLSIGTVQAIDKKV